MPDNIVYLELYRQEGNGAREVLIDHMNGFASNDRELAEVGNFIDAILARLWMAGYKIVPVEDDDAPEPPLYA